MSESTPLVFEIDIKRKVAGAKLESPIRRKLEAQTLSPRKSPIELQQKLEAAESRRQALEAEKQAKLKASNRLAKERMEKLRGTPPRVYSLDQENIEPTN